MSIYKETKMVLVLKSMIIKNEWLKMGCSLSLAVEITSSVGYKIITKSG